MLLRLHLLHVCLLLRLIELSEDMPYRWIRGRLQTGGGPQANFALDWARSIRKQILYCLYYIYIYIYIYIERERERESVCVCVCVYVACCLFSLL